jgi:hypothetical protein
MKGGITDLFMPTGHRQPGNENQRADLIPVLTDLPELAALRSTRSRQQER